MDFFRKRLHIVASSQKETQSKNAKGTCKIILKYNDGYFSLGKQEQHSEMLSRKRQEEQSGRKAER